MIVARIQNATRILGSPRGWDKQTDGLCSGLPIRDVSTSAGPGMESAWYPTPEEIAAIAAGAPVVLTVLGTGHPPVNLGVGEPPEENKSGADLSTNGQ